MSIGLHDSFLPSFCIFPEIEEVSKEIKKLPHLQETFPISSIETDIMIITDYIFFISQEMFNFQNYFSHNFSLTENFSALLLMKGNPVYSNKEKH